jgi:PAS domain S-box-containing protein
VTHSARPELEALAGPPTSRRLGYVAALIVAAGLALLDIHWSPLWTEDFGGGSLWVHLAIIAAGAALTVVAFQARGRALEQRRRFALLAAIADVADGTGSLQQTADALADLIVPAFADRVAIDVEHQGMPERLAERGDTTEPARSTMTVPLRTRGRTLGTLALSVTGASGRRYGPGEEVYAEVLSGRVALALDNAGLFAEVETIEAQFGAALGSLTDMVTIQDRTGRVVYANEAAARDLGYASARELMDTPTAAITSRYDVYTEDGERVEIDQYPGRRVLAGEDPAPLVVRRVDRASHVERWTVIKATGVRDRDGRARLAVNVVEDITEVKRAEITGRVLARASAVLTATLDYEGTLQQLADVAVPELADWCVVTLPDRRGYLRPVAVAHRDPGRVRVARDLAERYPARVDRGGAGEVLRTGVAQVVNDITDDMLRVGAADAEHYELLSRLGMQAAMVVPLLVGPTTIGALTLISAQSGRRFSDLDVTLASELGRRAGTAVQNARLYTERSEIAATLSEGLLPQAMPEIPGFETATLYRPAGAANLVGGDFYDAVPVHDGWLVLVGDVAGRGAPAATLSALARHTLRAVAQVLEDPLDAVERLNDELHARGGPALCTLACALLRPDEVTVACAGHPPPLLVRGRVVSEVGEFGPMVGAFDGARWAPVRVPLRPGDLLVFYTDGVTDTVGRGGERFGEHRVHTAVSAATGAADAVTRLDDALLGFQHGDQADDTAVVALERTS